MSSYRSSAAIVFICCIALLFVSFSATGLNAQDKKVEKKESEAKATPEKKEEKSKFKKYEEVITEKALTSKGIFITHLVEGKLYYEIPESQLAKDFLWVARLGRSQASFSNDNAEVANRVVRWERKDDKIYLKNIEFVKRADQDKSLAAGVERVTLPAIIAAFDIVSFAPDKTPVIEVTSLFTGDTPEFSPKNQISGLAVDKDRTYLDWVKSFPSNVEVSLIATYKIKPFNPYAPGRPEPEILRRSDPTLSSATVEVRHSMLALPEKPMRPREFDTRVGYFTTDYEFFSDNDVQVEKKELITRFRLEKKDENAELSEPVKPIVFYVGPNVPEKWKKWVKEGIEMWQPAFETAGFKNAIIGKYAPSKEEDPNWDPDDSRISTVRWLASSVQNAYGPHISDPRSGEILEADVAIYHNVVTLVRNWFYVQASPHFGDNKKLPLDDKLLGRYIRMVVCHEVGHSIGLRHNFLASSLYTIEQLRNPEWTEKNGISTSIMEYARNNYVAQPGDGADSISKIGPYDHFVIEWGYKQFKGTSSYDEDKPLLDKIAERQLTDPLVRFAGGREDGVVGSADPYAQTEDVGNDAVEATRLGLLNLERVMGYIVEGTSTPGKDYKLLDEIYGVLLSQWYTELNHVVNYVGGVKIRHLMHGQGEDLFQPLTAAKQKEALTFVLNNGFKAPVWLMNADVNKRIGFNNAVSRISRFQAGYLRNLFSGVRMKRMAELEATGMMTFSIGEMMEMLNAGLFEECKTSGFKVDVFRREIQRAYVKLLIDNIKPEGTAIGDVKALSRMSLEMLKTRLSGKAGDLITKAHAADLVSLITEALDQD